MALTREEWDRIWPLVERAARADHRRHFTPFEECQLNICRWHRGTLRMIQREMDDQVARLSAANEKGAE